MRKNKLKELFIEDLGQVTGGGGKATTLALGEEGPYPTTLAVGEEDPTTTKPWYEEDVATTLALGEEDDGSAV